jgi:pSer/pThr/pTyr-binding forkhead associated (FHA) protein
MKLSLLVLSPGKTNGTTIPITLPQFLIGRDPLCHLRPASPLISERHCALLVKGSKVFLRDLGSATGSFVNDEPVKKEQEIGDGDTLKIGPLLFRVQFQAPAVTPRNKPAPPPKPKPATAEIGSDDDSSADMLVLSPSPKGWRSKP